MGAAFPKVISYIDHPAVTPEPNSGCWLWLGGVGKGGHGCTSYRGKTMQRHRMSWELANGLIPDGMHVLHKCHNPSCVNPGHLYLGTHAQNMRDMALCGRRKGKCAGSANRQAKLTELDIMEIRYMRGRATQKAISLLYGVSRSCVTLIMARKKWKHI